MYRDTKVSLFTYWGPIDTYNTEYAVCLLIMTGPGYSDESTEYVHASCYLMAHRQGLTMAIEEANKLCIAAGQQTFASYNANSDLRLLSSPVPPLAGQTATPALQEEDAAATAAATPAASHAGVQGPRRRPRAQAAGNPGPLTQRRRTTRTSS